MQVVHLNPKCYTFLESGGLAELFLEKKFNCASVHFFSFTFYYIRCTTSGGKVFFSLCCHRTTCELFLTISPENPLATCTWSLVSYIVKCEKYFFCSLEKYFFSLQISILLVLLIPKRYNTWFSDDWNYLNLKTSLRR